MLSARPPVRCEVPGVLASALGARLLVRVKEVSPSQKVWGAPGPAPLSVLARVHVSIRMPEC